MTAEIVHGDADKPFVIVLGWLGANRKHVNKYAEIYQKLGYSTVTAIAQPQEVMLSNAKALTKHAEECLEAVLEKNEDIPGFYLHSFSNGGCFVYEHLTQSLHAKPQFSPIAPRLLGTVFDSCPCYLHIRAGMAAIGHAFSGNALIRWPLQGAFLMSVSAGAIWSLATGRTSRRDEFWNNLIDDQARCPSLYIASKTDPMLDVSKVEELADIRRGIIGDKNVQTLIFDDSPHIQHYRTHPEKYIETLEAFLHQTGGLKDVSKASSSSQ